MDPKVSLIIKQNPNEEKNQEEKERFNKIIRETSLGLYKNYKKSGKQYSIFDNLPQGDPEDR